MCDGEKSENSGSFFPCLPAHCNLEEEDLVERIEGRKGKSQTLQLSKTPGCTSKTRFQFFPLCRMRLVWDSTICQMFFSFSPSPHFVTYEYPEEPPLLPLYAGHEGWSNETSTAKPTPLPLLHMESDTQATCTEFPNVLTYFFLKKIEKYGNM